MKLHIPPRMWPLLGRRGGVKQSSSKKRQKQGVEEVLFEEALFAAEEPTVPAHADNTVSSNKGLPRNLSRAQKLPQGTWDATSQERYYSLLMTSSNYEEGFDVAQRSNLQVTEPKWLIKRRTQVARAAPSSQRSMAFSSTVPAGPSSPARGGPSRSSSNWAASPNSTLDSQTLRRTVLSTASASGYEMPSTSKSSTWPLPSSTERPCWLCRLVGASGRGCGFPGGCGCQEVKNMNPTPEMTSEVLYQSMEPASNVTLKPSILTGALSSGPPTAYRPTFTEDDWVVSIAASMNVRKSWKERKSERKSMDPRLSLKLPKKGAARKAEYMEVIGVLHKIMYGCPSIIDHFDDGQSLQQVIEDLKTGALSIDDLPPIRVAKVGGVNGNLVSVDQRRLYVLRQAFPPDYELPVKLIQSDWLVKKLEKSLPEGCTGFETVDVEEASPEFMEECARNGNGGEEPGPWTE